MKSTGTITLYNENGTRLSFYRYSNKHQRRDIIKYWEGLYKDRFQKFYYDIQPDEIEILNQLRTVTHD